MKRVLLCGKSLFISGLQASLVNAPVRPYLCRPMRRRSVGVDLRVDPCRVLYVRILKIFLDRLYGFGLWAMI